MKRIRSLVLVFCFLVSGVSLAGNSGYYRGICDFNGISSSYPPAPLYKEFDQMLKPRRSLAFQEMVEAISGLVVAPVYVLNDPECKVYKYVRDLLSYYYHTKTKFTQDKFYLVKMLDALDDMVTAKPVHESDKMEL